MANGAKRKRARGETRYVIGTPLLITDPDQLGARCDEWLREMGPVAVDFTSTDVATARRHNPGFKRTSDCVDCFIPASLKLTKALNRQKGGAAERIDGGTFMRGFLGGRGKGLRHYFLSTNEAYIQQLRDAFPGIQIVGARHGKCMYDGNLEGKLESVVREEFAISKPDCIWVGLGIPKQYAWVDKHKPLLPRGIVFTLDLADAAASLGKSGSGAPKDSASWRYTAWFLWYSFWDGLRGRAGG